MYVLPSQSEYSQSYQIFNMSGQVEMSGALIGGENIVYFRNDKSGIFLIKLTNGQETTTKRLLMIK
jgi:hypothetical protein